MLFTPAHTVLDWCLAFVQPEQTAQSEAKDFANVDRIAPPKPSSLQSKTTRKRPQTGKADSWCIDFSESSESGEDDEEWKMSEDSEIGVTIAVPYTEVAAFLPSRPRSPSPEIVKPSITSTRYAALLETPIPVPAVSSKLPLANASPVDDDYSDFMDAPALSEHADDALDLLPVDQRDSPISAESSIIFDESIRGEIDDSISTSAESQTISDGAMLFDGDDTSFALSHLDSTFPPVSPAAFHVFGYYGSLELPSSALSNTDSVESLHNDSPFSFNDATVCEYDQYVLWNEVASRSYVME